MISIFMTNMQVGNIPLSLLPECFHDADIIHRLSGGFWQSGFLIGKKPNDGTCLPCKERLLGGVVMITARDGFDDIYVLLCNVFDEGYEPIKLYKHSRRHTNVELKIRYFKHQINVRTVFP